MGHFFGNWGHFLIEELTRAWYLIDKADDSDYITYIAHHRSKLQDNMYELLTLLGVNRKRLIAVTSPTQFDKVIVPENSAFIGEYYTKEYKRTFDFIRDSVPQRYNSYKKKVYFTRLGSPSGEDDIGEKKICKVFESNGFSIAQPEFMSLKEKLGLLRCCEEFVCINGTLSHYLLFSKDAIRIVILNRWTNQSLGEWQPLINEMRVAEDIWIDAHIHLLPEGYLGPFLYWITKELKEYWKDNSFTYSYNERIYESTLRKNLVCMLFCLNYFTQLGKCRITNCGSYTDDEKNRQDYYWKKYMYNFNGTAGKVIKKILKLLLRE